MPTCSVCQKQNPVGLEYCEDCGAALTAGTAPAAANEAPMSARATSPLQPGASTPDPTGNTTVRLLVKRHGALTGDEIPLQADRLVVGRFDPDTGPIDLDLSEVPEAVHVSRRHAELCREHDGQWYVRDLGSTNGVFAKAAADAEFGPRISAPRALADGDEVALGNARFVFRIV